MNKKNALLMAVMSVNAPAFAASFDYAALIGKWRVTGVQLVNDGAVQALVVNDPQYMGARLQFSADNIVWLKSGASRLIDPAVDNCNARPRLTPSDNNNPDVVCRVAGGFNVLCGDVAWGPGAIIKPGATPNTVQLYWYDNGILTLTKELEQKEK